MADFTGRGAELDWLDGVAAGAGTTALISTIGGVAGVGKTALAVRWAYRSLARFPDGQLYLDLRGHGPGAPLTPTEALGRLLRAVAVPDAAVPSDDEEASALFRSTLADRRVLVLLDNAASAEQVRPLLPAGPGNLALVTSRARLSGLVARDGARRLILAALSPAESTDLLRTILGAARVAAEPAAVAELIELCGGLPLTLRIAAAIFDGEPDRTVAGYVTALRTGPRLAVLSVDDDPRSSVRSVFDESYRALPPAARLVFRRLGLVPGADITSPALADLADLTPAATAEALAVLVDGHLVTVVGQDRYGQHDLLREYAADLATEVDDAADRQAALRRLLGWQLGQVEAANRVLFPTVLAFPAAGRPARFADAGEAMRWLDRERANLTAGVRRAVDLDPPDLAWLLLSALRPYLGRVRVSQEMVDLADVVGPVAADHPRAAAQVLLVRADALLQSGRYDAAAGAARDSAEAAARDDWADARIAAANVAGLAYAFLGRLEVAAEELGRAADLLDRPGNTYRRSPTLNRLGMVHGLLGNLHRAVEYMEASVHHTREEHGGGLALTTPLSFLAVNRRLQGRHDLARAAVEQSLELIAGLQADHTEAILRLELAKILRDTGDLARAETEITAVLAVLAPSTDLTSRVHAHLTYASVLAERGETAVADAELERALALARACGNDHHQAETLITRAAVALRTGAPDRADADASAAHAIAAARDYRLLRAQALQLVAAVAATRGETATADAVAAEAGALYRECGHTPAPAPVSWLPTLSWP